jgi:hypothetical protein
MKVEEKIENYLMDIYFTKNRRGVGYGILINNFEQFIIESPKIIAPYGLEEYMGKHILNIEFNNYNKDNEVYNFYAIIKQIDNFLSNLEYFKDKVKREISQNLLNEIKNKTYISCIKSKGIYDPQLRTHMAKKGKQIITELVNSKNNKFEEIIKTPTKFTIKLDSIWIKGNCYGPIYYIKKCDLSD